MNCISILHVVLCVQNSFKVQLTNVSNLNTLRVLSKPIDCNLDECCFHVANKLQPIGTYFGRAPDQSSRQDAAACSVICFSSCAVYLYLAEVFSSWQVIAEKLLQDLLMETELPENSDWCCPVQVELLQ